MRREEADAERERRQRDDQRHTYIVREQPSGEWEVVQIGIPRPSAHFVAERGEPADAPEDPRPFLTRQFPPYGPGF